MDERGANTRGPRTPQKRLSQECQRRGNSKEQGEKDKDIVIGIGID